MWEKLYVLFTETCVKIGHKYVIYIKITAEDVGSIFLKNKIPRPPLTFKLILVNEFPWLVYKKLEYFVTVVFVCW